MTNNPLWGKDGSIGFDKAQDGTSFEIVHVSGVKFSLLVNSMPARDLLGVPWETIELLLTALTEAKSRLR